MRYPIETFSDDERAILAPHFTNLDRPVFALVNLPETVKGALFARYSRYPGTLRRLFLDVFAADIPAGGRPLDGDEGERAAGLYERVFMGFGDDSIAQVGGAHLACEWVSNILTKQLQRGRLILGRGVVPAGPHLPDASRGVAPAPRPARVVVIVAQGVQRGGGRRGGPGRPRLAHDQHSRRGGPSDAGAVGNAAAAKAAAGAAPQRVNGA